MGYVMLRASEWDYSDVEQRKTLQVINGQGTLEIGIAPTLSSRSLFRKVGRFFALFFRSWSHPSTPAARCQSRGTCAPLLHRPC